MKTRTFKVILSLVFSATSTLCCTSSVYAKPDFVSVSESKIDLSQESLLNPAYLNSKEIKDYLIDCIIKAEYLSESTIQDIKIKLYFTEFFCIPTLSHGSEKVLLRIWVPRDIFYYGGTSATGTLYTLPVRYETYVGAES